MIGYMAIRSWYWSNVSLWITLLVALAIGVLVQKLRHRIPALIRKGMAGLLFLVIIGLWGRDILHRIPFVNLTSELTYQSDSRWLEQNTPPASIIGMTGGGVNAYFIKDRTIVNLDGLMNGVEYFHRMQNGTVSQYLDRIGVDYVYGKPYVLLETDPYRSIFIGRLTPLDHGPEMTLYQYSSPP
jgi:hypothetical protein